MNSVTSKVWEFKASDIKAFLKYRYMFKQIGIEIWLYHKKKSMLLVFEDKKVRDQVLKYLEDNCDKSTNKGVNKSEITDMWVNGQITNFEYLMYLNTLANRSFCDLSQYPVFPWVIQDYQTRNLDLRKRENFRDLQKPIGAINKHRLQKLKVPAAARPPPPH